MKICVLVAAVFLARFGFAEEHPGRTWEAQADAERIVGEAYRVI